MKSYIAQREQYLLKVQELHRSGLCCGQISRKIPVPTETIRRWIRTFATDTPKQSEQMKESDSHQPSPAQDTQDVKLLEERIRELESQLKHERLRADFYDEMINVAESKFNIPIRKKAGAKR